MASRYTTETFTSASVSAGATLNINRTSLADKMDLVKIKVVPDAPGGSFDFKIYKADTFAAAKLLAFWDDVAPNLYAPMDISSGVPAEGLEGPAIPYDDDDASAELHLQIINNDGVAHTYTVTILWEAPGSGGGISGLTAGRVAIAASGTTLTDDADLTFSGATLTATNLVVSTLAQALWQGLGMANPTGAARLTIKQPAADMYGITIEASGNDAFFIMGHDGTTGSIGSSYTATAGYTAFALRTSSANRVYVAVNGNVGINTSTFGTNAVGVFAIVNGTAPTTGPADSVQFYSSDNAAGHTIPSFFCEGTQVLATGQADSVSSVRVKMRINGTVVTLLAI